MREIMRAYDGLFLLQNTWLSLPYTEHWSLHKVLYPLHKKGYLAEIIDLLAYVNKNFFSKLTWLNLGFNFFLFSMLSAYCFESFWHVLQSFENKAGSTCRLQIRKKVSRRPVEIVFVISCSFFVNEVVVDGSWFLLSLQKSKESFIACLASLPCLFYTSHDLTIPSDPEYPS